MYKEIITLFKHGITIVYGQASSIITGNHQRDCSPYQSQENALNSSLGLIPVNLRQYPVVSERTIVCFIYGQAFSIITRNP